MREKLNKRYLESLLIAKGVSEKHIRQMKRVRNRSYGPMLWYYREGPTVDFERVPVKEIRGLGFRGTINRSWFSHGLWHRRSNLDNRRILRAIDALERQNLQDFQRFYEEEPVRLVYYPGIGYFVNGDGTHRTLFAKLTNCSHVIAHVEYPILDKEKYAFFQKYKRSFIGFLTVQYAKFVDPYMRPPGPM